MRVAANEMIGSPGVALGVANGIKLVHGKKAVHGASRLLFRRKGLRRIGCGASLGGQRGVRTMTAAARGPYRVEAFNTAKASENKIHDDAVARRFGFGGGLVPGVDV
jgi:hypothetical protein